MLVQRQNAIFDLEEKSARYGSKIETVFRTGGVKVKRLLALFPFLRRKYDLP